MVNILVIDSREGDGILNEVIDFLSKRTYCQVTQLSSDYNVSSAADVLAFPGLEIHPKRANGLPGR